MASIYFVVVLKVLRCEDVYSITRLIDLVKDIFCPVVFFLVFIHIDCIEIKYPCCEQNNTHIDHEHVISIVLYHDFLLLFVGDISNVSDWAEKVKDIFCPFTQYGTCVVLGGRFLLSLVHNITENHDGYMAICTL